MASRTPKELQIPVPYGYIAAQEWGPSNGTPVLAMHGWMDNCGTFETLIPLLSPDLHIVAIDEPGVGLSSRLPVGAIIHYEDLVYDILRILNYLKWDRIIMMGHSRGAVISFIFAGMFPEKVEKIISLDIFKIVPAPAEIFAAKSGEAVLAYLETEKKSLQREIPVSPRDALDLLMYSHNGSLTEESAKIMMKRGTRKDKDKVIFTRDIRLKGFNVLGVEEKLMLEFLARMKCDLLIIRASGGMQTSAEEKQKWLETYAKCSNKFEYEEVEGTHHVHLNQPEVVAPIINKFLR